MTLAQKQTRGKVEPSEQVPILAILILILIMSITLTGFQNNFQSLSKITHIVVAKFLSGDTEINFWIWLLLQEI